MFSPFYKFLYYLIYHGYVSSVSVGLDAAGKTTILYKLKLGEIVTTIPTIGKKTMQRTSVIDNNDITFIFNSIFEEGMSGCVI